MSSILDALERASQDRSVADQVLIPKGHTDSLSHKGSGKWLLAVLVAFTICALAYLIYWMQVPPSKADSQDAQPMSQSISVIETNLEHVRGQTIDLPTPSKSDLEAQLIGSSVPSEHSLLAEAKLSRSPQVKRLVLSEKTSQTDKLKRAAPDTEVLQQPKSKRIPDASPRVAKREMLQQVVVPEKTIKPLIPEASEKPVVAKPESITKSDEQIPLIWELPQPLREALEQLKISIHVYHENPQRRFVIINMHRYAEGERLNLNGYRLKRIDREGIVVDYGDGLVRLLRERY